ncbi:MAG: FHA domain-containing protein [Candidatus Aminicenantes bacterium]|nr:MAG: FHA domain-containing protein [Candidatus Aminicenantes bacterium]
MVHIRIVTHDNQSYNFPIVKDEVTIGRGKDNDITLSDPRVSTNHAKITKEEEGYFLKDLGSHNGTRVNEKFIQKLSLEHNDEIRIGRNRLTYLTKEETSPSIAKALVMEMDTDYEKWQQRTVKINPEESRQKDSHSLLISSESVKGPLKQAVSTISKKKSLQKRAETESIPLERANKALFVLYEISRQLNSIHDFNELLKKIMDFIFMVIDADYGFLILTDDEKSDQFIPVVVKYKDERVESEGEIKASRTIINRVIKDKVALLTSNAMADPRFNYAQSLVGQKIRSAMCVPLWKREKIIGVIQLDSVRHDNQFTDGDLELLKTIGCQMAMILEQASLNEKIREEERMRNRLERFHSPQVIDEILKSSQEAKEDIIEAKDLKATILFTDIIGFTGLSEKMQPRDINMLLNQYFSRMTDIIFEYDGTLDKYIGDSLMAVFGAPIEKSDDAERAVSAALRMRRELADMMSEAGRSEKIEIRIGINTGHVVAGNIGSPKRMEYTVIGNPVNVASRLESLAQPNQIIIGEETYKQIKGKFKIKKIGPQKLRGKSEEIIAYEVLD